MLLQFGNKVAVCCGCLDGPMPHESGVERRLVLLQELETPAQLDELALAIKASSLMLSRVRSRGQEMRRAMGAARVGSLCVQGPAD
jgi:hypothetical protein